MLESEVGRAHIKGIIDNHLLEAGFDPYEGDMAKIVDAASRAIQELLKEYTLSVVTSGKLRGSGGM